MKIVLKIMAVFVLIACFSNAVKAQSQSSVTNTIGTAGVKLITPMTLSKTADLHFGTLILTNVNGGGSCSMPSNSTARTVLGDVQTSSVAPIATNAEYEISGTGGSQYTLTIPEPIAVTVSGGSATMNIKDLKAHLSSTNADGTIGTLSAGTVGKDTFTLGGTLTIGSGQLGGVYSGNIIVTVDYY